jgi:hypothetical protein
MLRRFLPCSLLVALVVAVPLSARTAFVRTVAPAEVIAVQPTRTADLVLLDGGFDAGLRPGMVCRIARAGSPVAEVVLVGLRRAHSAALILGLAPGRSIHPGDLATVKTLQLSPSL